MKIIPTQYQELETVYQRILEQHNRCIAFSSLVGGEGNTSIAMSVAKRLAATDKSVLYLDLNRCNPTDVEKLGSAELTAEQWAFDDISCQLNTVATGCVDFLGIQHLKESDFSREKDVVKEAIVRLLQEYQYIVIDLSPLNRKNQANVPIQVLADSVDLFLVTVSLGKNVEADLLQGREKLESAHFKQLGFLVSQNHMPALGPKLLVSIIQRLNGWSWLKNKLCALVKKQDWLFYSH